MARSGRAPTTSRRGTSSWPAWIPDPVRHIPSAAPVPHRRSALPDLCLAALQVFLLCILLPWTALAGQLTVDVLDVGQGDAILIRTADKAALIDAGPRGATTPAQLRALGVDRLDLVVATHPHADHIGRMAQIVRNFEVGLYIDSGMTHTTRTYDSLMEAIEEQGTRYATARAGMRLNVGDEAVFRVLFPAEPLLRGTRSDLNSNSVVLLLEHGDVRLLFTGDAEEPTEDALLADLGPVDVLKVAHHGSKHSSSQRFLRVVRPRVALVSVGADNRYDHPAPVTLQRLRDSGALVYRTDLSGNLRVVSDGVGIEVLEGTLEELDGIQIVRRRRPAPPDDSARRNGPPEAADPAPAPTLTRKELRRQRRAQRKSDRQQRRLAKQEA